MVRHSDNISSPRKTVAEGTGTTFDLNPTQSGLYFIYAEDSEVIRYKIQQQVEAPTGFLTGKTGPMLIGLIVIIISLVIAFSRKSKKPEFGFPIGKGV